MGNSEDSGNVVTEDKVKGKGKSKGREGGGSKARAQDGSNGLDAQEEKGATSSAGYRRGRRGHQRTTRSAASAVETKIEDTDVSAESLPPDLTRCSYNGQPIVKMRIADLRDALRALGCDQDGKRPELLDRLANRLLKDPTGGNSGPVLADETSERVARYQKRRTLKTFTPLCKGHDTKECPITIKNVQSQQHRTTKLMLMKVGSPIIPKETAGDEEPGAEASDTLGPLAAGSTKAPARTDAPTRTSGITGTSRRAVRRAKSIAGGGKGVDGRLEAGVSLAASPKPGMTSSTGRVLTAELEDLGAFIIYVSDIVSRDKRLMVRTVIFSIAGGSAALGRDDVREERASSCGRIVEVSPVLGTDRKRKLCRGFSVAFRAGEGISGITIHIPRKLHILNNFGQEITSRGIMRYMRQAGCASHEVSIPIVGVGKRGEY